MQPYRGARRGSGSGAARLGCESEARQSVGPRPRRWPPPPFPILPRASRDAEIAYTRHWLLYIIFAELVYIIYLISRTMFCMIVKSE